MYVTFCFIIDALEMVVYLQMSHTPPPFVLCIIYRFIFALTLFNVGVTCLCRNVLYVHRQRKYNTEFN